MRWRMKGLGWVSNLPRVELQRCQIWRRQRSRGGARCRAWAGCPRAASPRSSCLLVEESDYSDVSNLLQNEPTWNTIDRSERSEHAHGSDCWEVQLLHIKAVLKSAGEEEDKVKKVISWKGSPFLNVLVLYSHCPNSFRAPPPSVKRANVGKKVPQTILASLYTPPPCGKCPYGNNTFEKGTS